MRISSIILINRCLSTTNMDILSYVFFNPIIYFESQDPGNVTSYRSDQYLISVFTDTCIELKKYKAKTDFKVVHPNVTSLSLVKDFIYEFRL